MTTSVPSRRRRLTPEGRRALIEAAAREVFAEHGYHAASIGEIARRAGITKPTLYDHFPSKQDLHLALLRGQRDELFAYVVARLWSAGTPRERVRSAVDAYFRYVEEHPYAWRMLFRETTGDPAIAAEHEAIKREAHVAMLGLLLGDPEIGAAMRPVPRSERELVAVLIGGATHGAAVWWADHPGVPRRKVVDRVFGTLWDGLAAE